MKDIDFDELDRAVSSVLGQQGTKDDAATVSQTVTVAPDETTETLSSELSAAAEAENSSEPSSPAATPLAVKRRGKFMDVMHPSADMTSATPAAPVKPLRANPVLQPLSSEVTPEAASEAVADTETVEPTAELDESHALIGAEPAPVEHLLPEHSGGTTSTAEQTDAVDATVEKEVVSSETQDAPGEPVQSEEAAEPVKSLYVDPLELSAKTDEQQPDIETVSTSTDESDETSATPPATTPVEPSGTPFLSDAQVDKRPLGAFGETDAVTDAETAMPEQTPAADAQASPAVPLPRELQPDVVEVESSAQEAEASPAPFASGVKAPDADDGRVEGHPLFDTSTYHEPIAAVHGKGMPGWAKWLIGLLICLALGAGVGYFLFTAGL